MNPMNPYMMGFGGNGMMGMGGPAKSQKVHVKQTGTGQRSNGTIKSFNGLKGFGFISAVGFAADLFFLLTDLPADARNMHGNELQSKDVSFEIATTPDGKVRAQDIIISGYSGIAGQRTNGMIKSFNGLKGFGFIKAVGVPGDIFFLMTDLPVNAR